MGYEIIEQLGWKIPKHTVVCMASGSLLTKIQKSYQEFIKLGLAPETDFVIHGAQAPPKRRAWTFSNRSNPTMASDLAMVRRRSYSGLVETEVFYAKPNPCGGRFVLRHQWRERNGTLG